MLASLLFASPGQLEEATHQAFLYTAPLKTTYGLTALLFIQATTEELDGTVPCAGVAEPPLAGVLDAGVFEFEEDELPLFSQESVLPN